MLTIGLKTIPYWLTTLLFNILIITLPVMLEFIWIVTDDQPITPFPSVDVTPMGEALYNIYAFIVPFTVMSLFYSLLFDYSFVCFAFITAILSTQNTISDIITTIQLSNNSMVILFNLIQILDPFQSIL